LEGRVAEEWAQEVRRLVLSAQSSQKGSFVLEVDVTHVTSVDVRGEEVLRWLEKIGGKFHAGSASSLWLCERIGITPVQTASRK
jgi:hypothetical protein